MVRSSTTSRLAMNRILPLVPLLAAALPACAGSGGPDGSAAPSPAAVQPCTYPHGTALTHMPDGRTVAEAFAASMRAAARNPGARVVDVPPGALLPELANRREVARAIVRRYPRELFEQRRSGAVSLFVLVAADGRVADVLVLRPAIDRAFDVAALEVVREMRFRPAQVGGCAVPAFAVLPVTFDIEIEVRPGP